VIPEMFEYLKKKNCVQRSVSKGQFVRERDNRHEIARLCVASKGSRQRALIDIPGIYMKRVSTEITRKYSRPTADIGDATEILPQKLIYVCVLGRSLERDCVSEERMI